MNREKLAWLAGAWDGEGTFGLTSFNGQWFDKKRQEMRRESKLKPYIVLVNTNVSFIAEAVKILDKCGITLHLYEKMGEKKQHRLCYRLTSFNMRKIKAVIELILPYLISKKPQAELLLRFVDSRIKRMQNNFTGKSTPHYSEEELRNAKELMDQMRILNRRGEQILNDYTPDAGNGDDIV